MQIESNEDHTIGLSEIYVGVSLKATLVKLFVAERDGTFEIVAVDGNNTKRYTMDGVNIVDFITEVPLGNYEGTPISRIEKPYKPHFQKCGHCKDDIDLYKHSMYNYKDTTYCVTCLSSVHSINYTAEDFYRQDVPNPKEGWNGCPGGKTT